MVLSVVAFTELLVTLLLSCFRHCCPLLRGTALVLGEAALHKQNAHPVVCVKAPFVAHFVSASQNRLEGVRCAFIAGSRSCSQVRSHGTQLSGESWITHKGSCNYTRYLQESMERLLHDTNKVMEWLANIDRDSQNERLFIQNFDWWQNKKINEQLENFQKEPFLKISFIFELLGLKQVLEILNVICFGSVPGWCCRKNFVQIAKLGNLGGWL